MANDQNTTPNEGQPNGAAEEQGPRSLRDIAEAAWNTIETAPEDDAGEHEAPPAGQSGQSRDNLGRFVSKPGEQSSQDPAPQNDKTAPPVQQPSPAPATGSSSEAPQHWSAEDKATFAKLPKEGQDFLLKRHNEMERDYQSKVQANASAVQFTQAVAPVFQHPSVNAALVDYQTGGRIHPVDAIKQWAAFHVRAMSQDPNERAGLLKELAQRLKLDPAVVFGQGNRSGNLSEEDMKDPAIRFFADHISNQNRDLQALRDQLQDFGRQQSERASQESLKVIGWSIDQFADEKDQAGNLLHPHFDAVLPQVIELFQANPQRDLREAYEMAVWMNPQLRETLISKERQSVEQKAANERAAKAARMNVRGRTAPVSKPGAEGTQPKGLRAVISAAADEVGL
jgi:hypothetical protein